MKNIKIFLVMLFTLVMFTGCEAMETYVEYDTDFYPHTNYTVIVTNGKPYYHNNVLSYYLYNGVYYYPYQYRNVWYLRPYHRQQHVGFVYTPGRHHRPYSALGMNHRTVTRNVVPDARPRVNIPQTRPEAVRKPVTDNVRENVVNRPTMQGNRQVTPPARTVQPNIPNRVPNTVPNRVAPQRQPQMARPQTPPTRGQR